MAAVSCISGRFFMGAQKRERRLRVEERAAAAGGEEESGCHTADQQMGRLKS